MRLRDGSTMADPSCQTRAERDSLSRYRAIFQSALDFAIVATDREGSITDWNRGAEAIFGWSAEEMLGQTVERFFTPEDRADGRVADEMLRALQDGRSDDERWHLRKDGTRFWANGETMPLRDGAGEQLGFLKIVRDETARHAAAEKQRADDEVMRGVLSASDDCIKVLDLDANLLFMSEGGQRVMEVDDFETIRGCPWPDFWQGELNHEAEAAVAAARAGRGAQFRGLTPTMAGNPRWWDVRLSPIFGRDGTPEKLLSISRDVTPAMVAEQALREGEAHWRGLFEKLQEGFLLGELVRDGEGHVVDWRYLDVNPAWGGLVGIAPGDAKGRTVRDVFPGIEDAWIDEMAAVVDTGEPAVFTRQVDTIDRWYEGRAFPLDGDRFAASFLEVTARRRAEIRQAALLELGDRLREARDPVAAAYAAGEILGRTLRVSRAGYGTIDPRDEVFAVERDWNAPGVTTLAGSLRFRDFGSYIEDLKRGETVSIDDAALDPRTAATSAELTAISARAFINMPVLEAGGFVALGYVNNVEPRIWTEHDIAFMRDVTERTRSAVERRRAENRLRDLAASLERQVTDRTQERDGASAATCSG
jgi:PAS domain S-box-containing protein